MTEGQKDWARSHDWYVSAQLTRQGWVVTVVEHTGTSESNRQFDNYKELREWAGY